MHNPPDQPNSACCERCRKMEGKKMGRRQKEQVFGAEEGWGDGMLGYHWPRQMYCKYRRRGHKIKGRVRKDILVCLNISQ